MKNIEIQVVQNGYMVRKSCHQAHMPYVDDIFVFQTFEALTEWLSKNLSNPGDKP